MSTLTKVLIVLLTVFSIFLCGIVVTYVANAENQRERADKLQQDYQSARALSKAADTDRNTAKAEYLKAQEQLQNQIKELGITVSDLSAQLDMVKRERAQLVQKVTDMGAAVKVANETQASQMQQAQASQQDVVALRSDQTRLDRELKESNQLLMEKMAVVVQLESKNKQLIEANQELETRLNQYLQQYGKAAAAPKPVTPTRAIVQPAPPAAKDIGLNGSITALDLKNSLAEISIGRAAGVKQDMKFHVTRGQQFVCDIVILDVDADKAVGVLDLIQAEPRKGDTCTTNL